MKTLIFIRTHFIDDAIISEFKKLQNSLTENEYAVLLVNNEHNAIEKYEQAPESQVDEDMTIETVIYDKHVHEALKLPYYTTQNKCNTGLDDVMWACCDYGFFAVYKELPNYDFYWSLDYDIYCNGDSYRAFFDRYQSDADLIMPQYRQIVNEPDWEWQYKINWAYSDIPIYGGFFPVVRLSANAIKFLYKKRLEHAQIFETYKHERNNNWPYAEVFVPTELANNGFSCQILDTECLRFSPNFDLNSERIFEHPDFRLYHPVK